jgi:hypothetical protein
MKKINIPSNQRYPVYVDGKGYGFTGSPLLIPECSEFVHYGNNTSHVSDFEIKD